MRVDGGTKASSGQQAQSRFEQVMSREMSRAGAGQTPTESSVRTNVTASTKKSVPGSQQVGVSFTASDAAKVLKGMQDAAKQVLTKSMNTAAQTSKTAFAKLGAATEGAMQKAQTALKEGAGGKDGAAGGKPSAGGGAAGGGAAGADGKQAGEKGAAGGTARGTAAGETGTPSSTARTTGSQTAGGQTAGSQSAGASTAGGQTAGSQAGGTLSPGAQTAGGQLAGGQAAGSLSGGALSSGGQGAGTQGAGGQGAGGTSTGGTLTAGTLSAGATAGMASAGAQGGDAQAAGPQAAGSQTAGTQTTGAQTSGPAGSGAQTSTAQSGAATALRGEAQATLPGSERAATAAPTLAASEGPLALPGAAIPGEAGGVPEGRAALALQDTTATLQQALLLFGPGLQGAARKAKASGSELSMVYQLGPNVYGAEFVSVTTDDTGYITGPEVDIGLMDGTLDTDGNWVARSGEGMVRGMKVTLEKDSDGCAFVTDGGAETPVQATAWIDGKEALQAEIIAYRRVR